MTLRHYGRATPRQMDMLSLGGEILLTPFYIEPESDEPPTEEERLKAMREGWTALVRYTKSDFGYDLKAWHEFLLASPAHEGGYTHPYAWDLVRPKIESLIGDPERLRRAAVLEAELKGQRPPE